MMLDCPQIVVRANFVRLLCVIMDMMRNPP
jgi:hypothetical protein